jgi:hypothetical protein
MLDKQIAPTLAVTKEREYLLVRLRIDLTALWRARRPATPASAAVAAIGRHCGRRAGEGHYFLSKCISSQNARTRLESGKQALIAFAQ